MNANFVRKLVIAGLLSVGAFGFGCAHEKSPQMQDQSKAGTGGAGVNGTTTQQSAPAASPAPAPSSLNSNSDMPKSDLNDSKSDVNTKADPGTGGSGQNMSDDSSLDQTKAMHHHLRQQTDTQDSSKIDTQGSDSANPAPVKPDNQ